MPYGPKTDGPGSALYLTPHFCASVSSHPARQHHPEGSCALTGCPDPHFAKPGASHRPAAPSRTFVPHFACLPIIGSSFGRSVDCPSLHHFCCGAAFSAYVWPVHNTCRLSRPTCHRWPAWRAYSPTLKARSTLLYFNAFLGLQSAFRLSFRLHKGVTTSESQPAKLRKLSTGNTGSLWVKWWTTMD